MPEDTGKDIYNTGQPGLADSVLKRAVHPKLPDSVPSGARPVTVPLRVVVNEDGSVDPMVTIREWPKFLDGTVIQAIKAVRQWKYQPGSKDGHPVAVALDVDVVFE